MATAPSNRSTTDEDVADDEPAHDHDDEPQGEPGPTSVEDTLERAVVEGVERLERSTMGLLATGMLGGIDVGVGVLALLVVTHATGSEILGALAFPIGFIILTLARSELFTENFLVPITALVTGNSTGRKVGRLWAGTAASNLVGGWVVMWLVITAAPEIGGTATELAGKFIRAGIGWETFASSVLAGAAMTLLTWMERGSAHIAGRLTAALIIGFVISATPLLHSIVTSLENFGALIHGAPWGYADWAGIFAWSVLGNTVGGLTLVTALRLVQVDPEKLREEQVRNRAAEKADA